MGYGWPYGDTPVLVATTRPLEPAAATVSAVGGTPAEMVAAARAAAGGRGVYADGGALIRTLLDAGLVDEAIVTVIGVILGIRHAAVRRRDGAAHAGAAVGDDVRRRARAAPLPRGRRVVNRLGRLRRIRGCRRRAGWPP